MNNIFNYDSKVNQFLMKLGDTVILNALFLVFSMPIFTIGAAQSGLYAGFRVMADPEDDSSVAAAFFRGFKTGFTIITPVYIIAALITAVIAYCTVAVYLYNDKNTSFPTIISGVALLISVIFLTLTPVFHSKFGCTRKQLFRNTYLLLFAFPLRSIASVVLLWMPAIIFLLDSYMFIQFAPVWMTVWFGLAGRATVALMRKPFRAAEEAFSEAQEAEMSYSEATESVPQIESQESLQEQEETTTVS